MIRKIIRILGYEIIPKTLKPRLKMKTENGSTRISFKNPCR